jgi:hypothetical protein
MIPHASGVVSKLIIVSVCYNIFVNYVTSSSLLFVSEKEENVAGSDEEQLFKF